MSHATAPTAAPGTPPTRGVAPAQEAGASPRAAAAAEGSREGAQGVATAALASRATASAGRAAALSTPQKRGTDPARATGASPAAAAAAAAGREGTKYRAHANPGHTHTSPPKPFPPKPFPPGRTRHVRPPAPERLPPGVTLPQLQRQRDARRVIWEGGGASHGARSGGQEATEELPRDTRRERARAHAARGKGANTDGAPRPAAVEGDRAQAADSATQGREPGRGQGTGRARRGTGRAPRCMEWSEGRWVSAGAAKGKGTGTGRAPAPSVQARVWVTGGGTHGTGRRTEAWWPEGSPRARVGGHGPRGTGKTGHGSPGGEGGSKGGGRRAGRPRSRTCSR